MIARDRELLTRLGQVNASIGEVVLALMAAQDGGELPANGLREVGHALRTLADDMIARADELDTTPPARPGRCTLCGTEPVACPHAEAWMVESRFCVDCIDRCLSDTCHGHWCPVDAFAHAQETSFRGKARLDA